MGNNRIKLRLGILASILCSQLTSTLPALAEEAVVGRVFIVGDSLSDGGAYSEVARSIGLPTTTYYKPVNNKLDGSARTAAEHFGEYNGFNFVPHIVNDEVTITGLGISPYEDGGFNFAQSGARVELSNPQVAAISPLYTAKSFIAQIPDVIGAAGGRFNDNDVITLTIGANDFFNAAPDPTVAAANLQIAAAKAADGVRQFIDAGAQNIIVFNLPDAANVPLMQDIAAADPANSAVILDIFSQLSNFYTSSLESELASTRAVVFDLDRVTQFIVENPARYGFDVGLAAQNGDGDLEGTACQGAPVSGVSLLCLEGVNTISDPDLTYVFADGVHPTSEAHTVIAQALQGLFDGAVETARMLEALQESQRLADSWRSDRLRPSALGYLDENGNIQSRSTGDFQLTSNANYSSADTDSESIFGGADSGQLLGSLAVDVALAEQSLIGAEISVGGGDVDLGSTDADWSSYGLGLYGMSLISNGFYVNAAAGFSVINFDRFDRTTAT